ncbi:MAG: efflux RND transporter periplasmic adaptor subunit [Candidatus Moranbacteria bacterium]|nr:efflux RND transporter periplasmic adaptor subunit [Candidatus Moranbacteria bacterium]
MMRIIGENKRKVFISIVLMGLVATLAVFRESEKSLGGFVAEKKATVVGVEKIENLKESRDRIKYPAIVAGDQEINIIAGLNGTATAVDFRLGDQVGRGKVLVRIDDPAGLAGVGKEGFANGQIQQLENALKQSDEAYDQAKRNYDKDDTKDNKTAKDIAKLQKQNAQIALDAAVDNRLVKAPITGYVTAKNIAVGGSISAGQILATVSRPEKIKVKFYVSQEGLANVKVGDNVVVDSGGKEAPAKIANVSIQADAATKRFLVEAVPSGPGALAIGTVVDVFVDARREAAGDDLIILPLSAVTVGQNETYLFVAEDGQAKKNPAEIVKIFGENAEVRTDLAAGSLIIIDGSRLVQDGDKIVTQ